MFNISYSFLSDICKHGVLYAIKKKESRKPEYNFGSAYHMFLLQPEKFEKTYHVFTGDKRSKEYKELKSIVEPEFILSSDDLQKMQEMKKALLENPDVKYYMDMKKETVFYKEIEGLNWKGILDFWDDEFCVGADLKTCGSVDPKEIARQCYKNNYDMQFYIYYSLAKLNDFKFIFQETEYPYYSRVVSLDDEFYCNGEEKTIQALSEYISHTFEPEKPFKHSCEITFSGYMRFEAETEHPSIKWETAKEVQEKVFIPEDKEKIAEDNKNIPETKKTTKITKGMLIEKFGKEETEKKIKNFLDDNNKSSWSVLTEDERVSIYEA